MKEQIKKQKIIIFDIESSPNLGWFFGGIFETNILKIEKYETIICISYWDSETKKIKNLAQWDFKGWKKGMWNDKELIKRFREIIKDYDIIVGQNSDQFDCKLLNARLAYWGFEPLPEAKTFDTKKISKSKFKLPSYSLEYLANYFGYQGKYHHSGLDMWFKTKDGDKKAQKEMVHYCNIDVQKTKDVFLKILPFAKLPNTYSRLDNINLNCSNPLCSSKKLTKSKLRRVINGWKQQYQCQSCGHYTTESRLVKIDK